MGINIASTLAQGIFEALPISSSMHLKLIFKKDINEALMHFGTALTFTFILRNFIIHTIKNFNFKIICNAIIAVIPTIIIGYTLKNAAIQENAIFSLLAAILMLICELCPRKNSIISLSKWKLLIIGLIISLALIPGVSRLGITYTTLRLFQFRRFDALATSLLLGIPITLGAATIGALTAFSLNTLIESILAGSITYFVLLVTFRMINFWWIFAIYRIIFSALILTMK